MSGIMIRVAKPQAQHHAIDQLCEECVVGCVLGYGSGALYVRIFAAMARNLRGPPAEWAASLAESETLFTP